MAERILVVGDRNADHLTHREIDAALRLFPARAEAGWIATDAVDEEALADADGVWLVSGGPYRDDEAVVATISHCLDSDTPFLGTCSGFQYTCLVLARRAGFRAVHAELEADADEPLIAPLACSLYGEERSVEPVAGTRLAAICGEQPFPGFHFCGYGLARAHESTIEGAGAVISARAQDAGVEAIEVPEHRFFVATAFQPQVGASRTDRLHPLLESFLSAATASRERVPSSRGAARPLQA